MASLKGVLERIVFYNEKNQYVIGRLRSEDSGATVTVAGYLGRLGAGESLKFDGRWETHPRYGRQFKADHFEAILPDSREGIEKYLKSGIIKGIGNKTADRLLRHFKEKTIEIIEKNPEKLTDVRGIGERTAFRISEAWRSHYEIRELTDFLHPLGVHGAMCSKILKKYGPQAVILLQNTPYRLVFDIPGFDFFTADNIANHLGFHKNDPERIKACISYQLDRYVAQGHTFMPGSVLAEQSCKRFQIDPDAAMSGLDELVHAGAVVRETSPGPPEQVRIYPAPLYEAETGIARHLNALISIPEYPPEINREQIAGELFNKMAIQPSEEQMDVLESILTQRAAIITGGPGTGKTTLVRSIVIILSLLGKKVLLAAPTGRAARRLSEVTLRKAETIHKMLRYDLSSQTFEKNRNNPLDADAVIIDEASMVDTLLMFHLLNAVSMYSRLILVGDIFQLPSIGPGNVLSDLIGSGKIKAFELTQVFRQADQSPIVAAAHKIRQGRMPDLQPLNRPENSHFFFIELDQERILVDAIASLCTKKNYGPADLSHVDEIQVITPMHRGAAGTINLNQVLQKSLNSEASAKRIGRTRFKINDKVMHLRNNYQKDVFNGDIGVIREIDDEEQKITVDYDEKVVTYDYDEIDDLSLAYAISVHKSQGSEYGAVILPLVMGHFALLQRNLLYTAVTRGKNVVILIGNRKALETAINNDKPRRRLSALTDKMQGMK